MLTSGASLSMLLVTTPFSLVNSISNCCSFLCVYNWAFDMVFVVVNINGGVVVP